MHIHDTYCMYMTTLTCSTVFIMVTLACIHTTPLLVNGCKACHPPNTPLPITCFKKEERIDTSHLPDTPSHTPLSNQ